MKIETSKQRLDVRDADLSGSSFDDANLSGATLHNVNMAGWTIDDANMAGWRVENVNLAGLRVTKANLAGATLAECRIDGMRINGVDVADLFEAYAERTGSAARAASAATRSADGSRE